MISHWLQSLETIKFFSELQAHIVTDAHKGGLLLGWRLFSGSGGCRGAEGAEGAILYIWGDNETLDNLRPIS